MAPGGRTTRHPQLIAILMLCVSYLLEASKECDCWFWGFQSLLVCVGIPLQDRRLARDPHGRYNDYISKTSILPNPVKILEMDPKEATFFNRAAILSLVVTMVAFCLIFTPLRFLLEAQGMGWIVTVYIIVLIVNDLIQQANDGKGVLVATNYSRKESVVPFSDRPKGQESYEKMPDLEEEVSTTQ